MRKQIRPLFHSVTRNKPVPEIGGPQTCGLDFKPMTIIGEDHKSNYPAVRNYHRKRVPDAATKESGIAVYIHRNVSDPNWQLLGDTSLNPAVACPAPGALGAAPPVQLSILKFVFKELLISTTALFVLSLVTGLIHAGESKGAFPNYLPFVGELPVWPLNKDR